MKCALMRFTDAEDLSQPTITRRRGRKATCKKDTIPAVDVSNDGDQSSESKDPDPVKTPSKRPPPKRTSYATPTGPAYQARISAIDAEHRLLEEERAKRVQQEHAKSHIQIFTLRWWMEVCGSTYSWSHLQLTRCWSFSERQRSRGARSRH